jgi:hypothetical protein
MKSPYETLREHLRARFPRIVTGDSEVVDDVDSEHTIERLAPLYQLPAWEITQEIRAVSRRLRVEHLPDKARPARDHGRPPIPRV